MEPSTTEPTSAPNSSTRRPLLYTDDLNHFDAISIRLGITGTAAQRFHALLEWAQQQLDGDPTQATVVLPVLSDQAKTLAWLTEEISTLRQQLTTAQQDAQAARTLRSDRSILQAKIDSLAGENLTLRRRLERFDSLRHALMGSGDTTESTDFDSTTPEAYQTAPAAPRATEGNKPSNAAPPPATQRRPASAQERAARIWQVIQEWNQTHNRPPTEKVALSASTLEKRFGIYRPAAQQFMADHQAEIAAHAQAHAITAPAHNRSVLEFVWEILKERAAETD